LVFHRQFLIFIAKLIKQQNNEVGALFSISLLSSYLSGFLILKIGLVLLGAFVMGALFYWIYWHVTHPDQGFEYVSDAGWSTRSFELETDRKSALRVMTYNMGWAVGPVQKAVRDQIELGAYQENLDEIVRVIKDNDVDIVLLQEADVDASRSHRLDQVAYLQEKLEWSYVAQVADWKRWIPFEGVRNMHRCLAVLSKYPIVKHAYKRFTFYPNLKSKFLTFMYNPFIWKSSTQHVQIVHNDATLNVFNVHLSVLSEANRLHQMNDLVAWAKRDGLMKNLIVGGDFNFQGQVNARGFELKTPLEDKLSLGLLQELWQAIPGMQEAFISSTSTLQDIHEHVTFIAEKHRYDFLFFSEHFQKVHAQVIQGISVSDHFPVCVALHRLPSEPSKY
jgi:endonuclease/exonuclease/phosphatase family metal-dependent hydrolase